MIIENNSLMMTLQGLKSIILLAGNFIIIKILINNNYIKFTEILKIFLIFAFVNIFMTISQIYFLSNKIIYYGTRDLITGLFNNYFDLVFFQIFCIIVYIVYWRNQIKLIKLPFFFVIGFLLIPIILSNSRAAWLYIIISIFLLIKYSRLRFSKKEISLMVSLGIIVIAGLITFNNIMEGFYTERSNDSYAYLFNYDYIKNYIFTDDVIAREDNTVHMSRGFTVIIAYEEIKKSILNSIIGYGSGTTTLSQVVDTHSLASKYNTNDLSRISISRILGDFGFLGISLTVILLILFYLNKNNRATVKIISLRKIFTVLIILSLIYFDPFESPIMMFIIAFIHSNWKSEN